VLDLLSNEVTVESINKINVSDVSNKKVVLSLKVIKKAG